MLFGRRFLCIRFFFHDYSFRREIQKRGTYDCRRICNAIKFLDVLR